MANWIAIAVPFGTYQEVVPGSQLMTHPGSPEIPTLTAIRNVVFDRVEDDVLVFTDDDVVGLLAMPGWNPRRRSEPEQRPPPPLPPGDRAGE